MAESAPTPDSTEEEPTWQILGDFSIPSTVGNERDAMRLVEEAIRPLNLPPDRLDRLKTAVSEATMNASEHGNHYRPDLPVIIKVLASSHLMSVQITDFGIDGPIRPGQPPDINAKLEGLQHTRGWGFFLIEKMVDEVQIDNQPASHTIQLFLYLEGHE